MTITVLAAVAANNVIGIGPDLAWHDKEELKLFKDITTGDNKLLVVGSKTFFSMPEYVWKSRKAVVITGNSETRERAIATGCGNITVSSSIDSVLLEYRDTHDVYAIGGRSIYAQVLLQPNLVDRLIISEMHWPAKGDVTFPTIFGNYERSGVLYAGANFTAYVWRNVGGEATRLWSYPHKREHPLLKGRDIARFFEDYNEGTASDFGFFSAVTTCTEPELSFALDTDSSGCITLRLGQSINKHLPAMDRVAKTCAAILGHPVEFKAKLNAFETVLTGNPRHDVFKEFEESLAETERKYLSSDRFRTSRKHKAELLASNRADVLRHMNRVRNGESASLRERLHALADLIQAVDSSTGPTAFNAAELFGIISSDWFNKPVTQGDASINIEHLDKILFSVKDLLATENAVHPITSVWLREQLAL